MIGILIDKGADLTIKDCNGNTAYNIGKITSFLKMYKIFKYLLILARNKVRSAILHLLVITNRPKYDNSDVCKYFNLCLILT